MRELKKYCEGLDCGICDEKEPCIRKIANELEEKLLRKEQECERLKIYIESNEQQVKEVEKLVMDNARLVNELDKLSQALAEIKEIATTGLEGFCPKCSRKDCEDNNCIETAARDILQIIDECERTLY